MTVLSLKWESLSMERWSGLYTDKGPRAQSTNKLIKFSQDFNYELINPLWNRSLILRCNHSFHLMNNPLMFHNFWLIDEQ